MAKHGQALVSRMVLVDQKAAHVWLGSFATVCWPGTIRMERSPAKSQRLVYAQIADVFAGGSVAPLLPWWIPAGQPPGIFAMIGRHARSACPAGLGVVTVVTIVLCIDPESREYLLATEEVLSIVSTGMLRARADHTWSLVPDVLTNLAPESFLLINQ